MANQAASVAQQKRRQAVRIAIFLASLAGLTSAVFQFVRRDLVDYRRGQSALAREDYRAAADSLGRAWDAGYRTATARNALARARLAAGDAAGALPLYEAALAEQPDNRGFREAVAGIYQSLGESAKARELLEAAGPIQSLAEPDVTRLAEARLAAGDVPGARTAYQEALARRPKDASLHTELGILLAWEGRRSEAIESFRAALALDPAQKQARLHLGQVLMWEGRFADAVTEYRTIFTP